MSREKIDFDVVQEIARKLPDVEESSLHCAPSLKGIWTTVDMPRTSQIRRANLARRADQF
jgi:hypothetical protein